MDEAEWLGCVEPAAMLAYLAGPDSSQMHLPAGRRVGRLGRKLRLFACAVAWLAHGGTSGQVRENVERAYAALERGHGHPLFDVPVAELVNSELGPALADRRADAGRFAAALRDVMGNPFRPAASAYRLAKLDDSGWSGLSRVPAVSWLTPAVLGIARRAYDDRDFAALPVLADALEEAGCREEPVLRHLRGWEQCPECVDPSGGARLYCTRCGGSGWILGPFTCPHVRGCWVADLVLGKE